MGQLQKELQKKSVNTSRKSNMRKNEIELVKVNTKESLIPLATCVVGNILFFSDRHSTGIWAYDLRNGSLKVIGENRGAAHINMNYKVVQNGDQLFFLPFNAVQLCCYDLKKETMSYIDLPCEMKTREGRIYSGVAIHNKLWLFGYNLKYVFTYDISRGEFDRVRWAEEDQGPLYIRSAVCYREIIYAVSICHDAVYEINPKKETIIERPLNTINNGYTSVTICQSGLMLTPYEGDSLIWVDIANWTCKIIACEREMGEWIYGSGFMWKDTFYAIPCYGKYYLRIDLKTQHADYIEKYPEKGMLKDRSDVCGEPYVFGHSLYTPYLEKGFIEVIDLDSFSHENTGLHIYVDEVPLIRKESVVRESNWITLNRFIRTMQTEES